MRVSPGYRRVLCYTGLMNWEGLIRHLKESKAFKTSRIEEAFRTVDRADFAPEEAYQEAYQDHALVLGFGQTMSQPTTIALMLEWLQPKEGEKILEIGTGSGYVTALLAYIAGKRGHVYSIEYVRELSEYAHTRLQKYPLFFKRIKLAVGDGKNGWVEFAPFDAILSGAAAEDIPLSWQNQLTEGGRIVSPVCEDVWLIVKHGGNFHKKVYPGFSFVPLK